MKFIARLIIPAVLILIWFLSLVRFINIEDLGFLSLDDRFKVNQLSKVPVGEIHKGDIIKGKFSTPFPNLGIIGFRFLNLNRINKDQLEFRIRQDGDSDWFYKATYNTDQFQPNQLFPFGFPTVTNSNNKSFHFEIESLHGATGSAVAVGNNFPTYIGRHVFDKKSLLENKRLLLYFIFHKTLNLFSYQRFTAAFITYSLPFLFYVFFTFFGLTFHLPTFLVFLMIVIDIFLVRELSDTLAVAIIFAWLLPAIKFRFQSKISWSLALCCLLLTTTLNLLGLLDLAEKAAFWSFMFFATAVVTQLVEFKTNPKHQLSLTGFWRGCRKGIELLYLIIIGEITITIEEVNRSEALLKQKQSDTRRALLFMLFHLGKPISTTYVYTSRLYSLLIFLLVHFVRALILYGPYVLLAGLFWKQITDFQGYYNLYHQYYIRDQSLFFWANSGKYLVVLFSLLLLVYFIFVIFVIVTKKFNFRAITLVAIVCLFVSINSAREVFNNTSSFQYDVTIWSIGPNDTREPWVDVTISGRNFSNMPFVGRVFIDKVEQRVIYWSDKEIVFRTNPSITRSGKVIIVTAEGEKSNPFTFNYFGDR